MSFFSGFLNALWETAESGKTPADIILDDLNGKWGGDVNRIFSEYSY